MEVILTAINATDGDMLRLADQPRRGKKCFCRVVWKVQKRILKERYNIDWQTPREKRPRVFHD